MTYAALVVFTLGPGTREIADKAGEQFGGMLQAMKGFKGMTMLADYDAGEYAGMTLWETKEDAEAALAATQPVMKESLGALMKGPPTGKLYQVWEPPKG
jgi:heme-degrading monooxygenase HmoA